VIAACPTCGARYRIDAAKLRPEGARLRCTRCEAVFRVQAPAAPEAPAVSPVQEGPVEAPAAPAAPPPQVAAAPAASAAPPPRQDAPEQRNSDRLVLVASPEHDAGKAIVRALSDWDLDTILVHDGVEAILSIQRALPRAVVLDAALPKMFGFQICELMKRNECLREIKVILVGAIHDQSRYRRAPEDLYGADAYTERHQLPEGLRAHLETFGLLSASPGAPADSAGAQPAGTVAASEVAPPVTPPAAAESAPPVTATPQPPAAAPEAPTASAPAEPAQSEAYEKAARLARIIISDIVLYNQEAFDAAVRAGNVLEALAPQMAEGHALFAERVDPSVGDAQEFLNQELLRIARSKGMNS
jgi:predicted Zn finger-like uncharacterized protein